MLKASMGGGQKLMQTQYTLPLWDKLGGRFAAVSLIPGWALSWLWQLFLPAVSQRYCQDALEKQFVLLALLQPGLVFPSASMITELLCFRCKAATIRWWNVGSKQCIFLLLSLALWGFLSTLCCSIAFWDEYWKHSQFFWDDKEWYKHWWI